MPLLEATNLVKSYPSHQGDGQKRVVDNVSFSVERGKTLGIVGESGSGKSTVARLLLRLIEADSGTVRFDGHEIFYASNSDLRRFRRRMQIVFQDPYAALNPRMRVSEIVGEPLLIYRDQSTSMLHASSPGAGTAGDSESLSNLAQMTRGDQIRQQIQQALRMVGLDASALPRYPHEFSGGQRQRINLARALILRPDLVVLDEPTSALDVSVSAQIVQLLRDLQRDLRLTYIFITHSIPLVRYMADEILVMQQGRVVERGGWEEICDRPKTAYTRDLLAAIPEMPSAAI